MKIRSVSTWKTWGWKTIFDDSTAFEPTIELVADLPSDFGEPAAEERADSGGVSAESSVEIELDSGGESIEIDMAGGRGRDRSGP